MYSRKFAKIAYLIWKILLALAVSLFMIGIATENLVVYYIVTVLFIIVLSIPVIDFIYKLIIKLLK